MNSTFNITDVDQPNLGAVFLVSGSFLAVICPLTVLANVLLLIAIYKDPFKTFRTPTACFLVGLAITDVATGLVPEPMVTSCYFMHHHQHSGVERCEKIFNIAGIIAAITTNSSFLIVMAFTFAQYVAIAFPLKYKPFISVRKTLLCVACIWVYSTLFEMSQTVGVPKELVEKIDLYIHSTLSLLFTILTYALLQRAFRKQMTARSATLHTTNSVSMSTTLELHPRKQRRKSKPMIERNFVRLNILLIVVLLLCSQPTAILWYIYLYADEDTKNSQTLFVVRVIADNTLYLKFFLDPFLFAWRLPKYRKALRAALSRRK
ncbi:adenosine receptor A1-like [Stylophora pistillata]|uniref:adenosine receptor A1-like n=1 Tax=Stylophora pistillata TaxID=50429 RepID=UPI000C03A36E|nr:adenosine receptor A1-like [Stylophora pistillata]